MTAKLEITSLAAKMPHIYEQFVKIKSTPEITFLDEIFTKEGFEIRMAGGAVRDLLTGKIPSDIDFATVATPVQMDAILSAHPDEIRLITTKSGIMHGTITARINDRVQYEITTLRIDKKTDGRHAEVEFITDWMLDASRRDLTINSMFLDLKGDLYDYFGGAHDLAAKEIKFVGNPRERIEEDYLRIFRYFRFYVRYGSREHHDDATIQAIIDGRDGLKGISGERIWSEMKKILLLHDCKYVMPVILNRCLIAPFMGFISHQIDLEEFNRVHACLHEQNIEFNPATLLTSLISSEDEMFKVVKRLKMSNQEREVMHFILLNRDTRDHVTLDKLKRMLALHPRPDQKILLNCMMEFLKYIGKDEIRSHLEGWTIPNFPVSGYDLKSKVDSPKHIKYLIDHLKEIWADCNYTLSPEQIDSGVREALEQIAQKSVGSKDEKKQ